MTDGAIAAICGVAVAGLGGIVKLVAMWIEKYKPVQDRRNDAYSADIAALREMGEARDRHAKAQDAAIMRQQGELEKVHQELSAIRRRQNLFYDAISRCRTKFVETREWWDKELAKIDA